MNDCSPERGARTEVAVRIIAGSRPGPNAGKADVSWEETSMRTMRSAGVGVQASREGSAEITSGRAISQQGLTTTCKDPSIKAQAGDGGRDLVWRMSPYERGRRGNALRGGAGRHPARGNPASRQRGSGHLAVPGPAPDSAPGPRGPRSRDEPVSKPGRSGAYARQRLSFLCRGKVHGGKPRSEPDSGNPTVRDRREACGNVIYDGTVPPPRRPKGRGWKPSI